MRDCHASSLSEPRHYPTLIKPTVNSEVLSDSSLSLSLSLSIRFRTFDAMASSMAKPGALTPLYSQLNDFPLLRSTSISTLKFRDSQLSLLTVTLKRTRNASVLPVIRAQSSPDYVPDAKFYKVEAILRPWRVPQVSSALLKMGIRGVTVSDVRGFGAQGGLTERQAGSEFSEDKFLAKVKMEIVVSKDQVESVIDKIIEQARTGEIGDGKIFLVPVTDVIRIRTGERGEQAERMVGGRADMSSVVQKPHVI